MQETIDNIAALTSFQDSLNYITVYFWNGVFEAASHEFLRGSQYTDLWLNEHK